MNLNEVFCVVNLSTAEETELRSPFSEVKSLLHYLLSNSFTLIGGMMMMLVLVLRWFLL